MPRKTIAKTPAKTTAAVAASPATLAKNTFNYGPTAEARRLPRRIYYKPAKEWIVLGGVHKFISKSRGDIIFREATPKEYYELAQRFPQFIKEL